MTCCTSGVTRSCSCN